MMKADELIRMAKIKVEEIANKDGLSGIATGFVELDKITSGFQSCDLITIGARPAMGKTAFALSIAKYIAVEQNIPVVYFSPEMSSIQLINRLISSETGLSSEKLRTGKLAKHEWEQLNVKVKGLEKAPLFIDDSPEVSIEHIIEESEKLVSKFGVKIIFIDYLQLISIKSKNTNTANRNEEVSYVVKKLKSLAKNLNLPIILISQLNRALEARCGSKRPALIDFRDSGTIEDDSDLVCFLYRPEYYKIDEWDDEERSPTEGQVELIIAKHRNGREENIRLKFLSHLGKFDNLDTFESPFEFHGMMNVANDDTFRTDSLPSADEAFGSSMNDDFDPDEGDVPF